MTKKIEVASGTKFGRWTVLREGSPDSYHPTLVCRCECGTEREVRKGHLRGGMSQSCGCLHSELSSARAGNMHRANTIHGLSKSRAHNIWMGMNDRCKNPNNHAFKHYGGRGIEVCERWLDFVNFFEDMGHPPEKYTLERRDNNASYSPSNCYWASRMDQQNNRRVNRRITIDGETKTISQWSRISGVHRNTITQRLDNGVDPVIAISSNTKPIKPSKFTESDIRLIRSDPRSQSELARLFNVTVACIWNIKHRKTWKDVP